MSKSVVAGVGEPCPKCKKPMVTKTQPPDWQPKPGQPFYFTSWDVCKPCGMVQHYERNKVYVDQPKAPVDPVEPVVTRPAPPPGRIIPSMFTGAPRVHTVPPWEDEPERV
jgi:hypothetical protein